MAYVIIDGYNLIGTAHNNLEKARNDLIDKLRTYSGIKKHRVMLVFDGWKSGQKDQTEIRARDLTVIFSRLGEKADVVIKRMVRASAGPCIVVSSDREIAEYTEKHGHAAVSSAEFEEKLYRVLKHPSEDSVDPGHAGGTVSGKGAEDDAPPSPARSGGNPRQLSKRQKNRIQALRKL